MSFKWRIVIRKNLIVIRKFSTIKLIIYHLNSFNFMKFIKWRINT